MKTKLHYHADAFGASTAMRDSGTGKGKGHNHNHTHHHHHHNQNQNQNNNAAVASQIAANPTIASAVQSDPALGDMLQADPSLIAQIQANPALLQQLIQQSQSQQPTQQPLSDTGFGETTQTNIEANSFGNPLSYQAATALIKKDGDGSQGTFLKTPKPMVFAKNTNLGAFAPKPPVVPPVITPVAVPAKVASGLDGDEEEEKEGMPTWEKALLGFSVLGVVGGAIWYFGFRKKK